MKKYLAEMVGTMVLVLMGCGVAVSLGCDPINNIPAVVGTAFAFGLAVVAMAYTIGGISGCHINPAITLGCFLSGRIWRVQVLTTCRLTSACWVACWLRLSLPAYLCSLYWVLPQRQMVLPTILLVWLSVCR